MNGEIRDLAKAKLQELLDTMESGKRDIMKSFAFLEETLRKAGTPYNYCHKRPPEPKPERHSTWCAFHTNGSRFESDCDCKL